MRVSLLQPAEPWAMTCWATGHSMALWPLAKSPQIPGVEATLRGHCHACFRGGVQRPWSLASTVCASGERPGRLPAIREIRADWLCRELSVNAPWLRRCGAGSAQPAIQACM